MSIRYVGNNVLSPIHNVTISSTKLAIIRKLLILRECSFMQIQIYLMLLLTLASISIPSGDCTHLLNITLEIFLLRAEKSLVWSNINNFNLSISVFLKGICFLQVLFRGYFLNMDHKHDTFVSHFKVRKV